MCAGTFEGADAGKSMYEASSAANPVPATT
jgi:hypothetical protein